MKLVAGHLTLKDSKYYAVLNYKNAGGQRKTKWISLGLSEKGNKRKAEAELARLRAEFEPPKEAGDLLFCLLSLLRFFFLTGHICTLLFYLLFYFQQVYCYCPT